MSILPRGLHSPTAQRAAKEGIVIPATVEQPPAATPASPSSLVSFVLDALEEEKAEDVVSIDLAGKSSMADHMLIASGTSHRHVCAIAEHLAERLKHERGRRTVTEGADAGDWVLIDAGDVLVHVFRPEVRAFYNLEKLWLTEVVGSAAG